MNPAHSRAATVLSTLIVLLAAVASAGGLLFPGLYRDNAFVRSTWVGNDLMTLVVAVPALVAAMVLAGRGSAGARLVWLGLLDYMLYNFAFYLFGTAFNLFFLVYVALCGLSIYALIFGFLSTDVAAIGRQARGGWALKAVGGFMLFIAAGLTLVYVAQWAGFATTGALPPIVTRTAIHTSVVFALDLTLVVPLMALAGVWVWQGRPWGYALAVVANVKGAVYMLALSAATVTAHQAGTIPDLSELGLWGTIGVLSLAACLALLAGLRRGARRA